jgi:hypothetical protein
MSYDYAKAARELCPDKEWVHIASGPCRNCATITAALKAAAAQQLDELVSILGDKDYHADLCDEHECCCHIEGLQKRMQSQAKNLRLGGGK